MQCQRVDLDSGRLLLFRRKTSQGFAIPIYPELKPLLERLCAGKTHSQHIFRVKQARKPLRHACRRLGLPFYSHRSLRRCFITRAIEKGLDVKVIAQWQNHKDGGKFILDTYSHVNPVHSNRMAALMTSEEPENVIPLGQEQQGG